jgi:Fibronectin type III domain.
MFDNYIMVILNKVNNLLWSETECRMYLSSLNKLFIVCCLLFISVATAQVYPVQVTPQLVPPYSFRLSDYKTATNEKLILNLLLTDAQESGRQVRLKMYMEGQGLHIQTLDFVAGASPILLDGGINLRLTNLELQPYFELTNLVGISPVQYGQSLPEGKYDICFEVYDMLSGKRISKKNCATMFLILNDPPFLNVPGRGDLVTAQNPQNIVFNWTPRHFNAPSVQYEFTLKELWDKGMDPQAAFMASPPLYQTTTFATTLLYGPADIQLLEGKTYAWQVRAFTGDGATSTSLFRNNGYSEVYHFTYTANCSAPMYVLSEAKNSRTVRITWQNGTHLRYQLQYRKKGYGEEDWFEFWTQNSEVTIQNLEAGQAYEFRVGGECTPQAGLAYSAVHEFTMPTEEEMAYYNCGMPPEVEIDNQDPLPNLGVNEVFTAGDFPITVKWVDDHGGGRFSGWGFMTVPYLADTKIRVEFENIKINTDHQMVEGMVETSYDGNWSGVVDVDQAIEDVVQLFTDIAELLSNYTGTEEEVTLLQELNQKQDAYISELISSPYITIETKNELVADQEVYKTVSNDLIAESTDADGYDTGSGMAAQVIQKNKELQTSMTKAEDEVFVGESFAAINNDPSFKGTFENLKKLIEYFKETKELCEEEGWASYQDQGIVPWCIWKEAEIPELLYHTKLDLPFVSGVIDGIYQEGEGIVKLPQMLYQLGNGINDFIYAYTWAYLQCTPGKVKLNEERLGKLLDKLEAEKKEDGIWSWVKTQWYSLENYVANLQKQNCEDAAKLRHEIDELIAYVQEIENIKNLIEEVRENLADYWSQIEQKTNVGRYEEGKIVVVVGSLFISVGALAATKIGRVKQILQKLHSFTKGQWDEFFGEVGVRLGRNGNLFSKFGQKLDEIGEVLENGLVKGKYSGRVFNPNNAGGAIKSLNWENAIIKKENIEIVKKHLGRLESDPWNDAMIKRLEDIEGGKIVPTDYDKKFITHEIGEFERYKELGYENTHYSEIPEEVWNNAHSATLEDYSISDYIIKPDGMRDYQLYHPDVQQIPE